MPQPIAHYWVIENSLNDISSANRARLWHDYSNYAVFGSIFPDLMYMSGVPRLAHITTKGNSHDYSSISDILHWEGSLDLYCSMLDYIKQVGNKVLQDKLKAFAYGFMSHVVTDSDIHPSVYGQSEDHPFSHPDNEFTRHKSLESLIDIVILGHRNITYGKFDYSKKLVIHGPESNRTLDQDVFKMVMRCIEKTYAGTIFENHHVDYGKIFQKFEGSQRHPILEAYRDIVKLYRFFDKFYLLSGPLRRVPFIPTRFRVLLPRTMIHVTELSQIVPDPRKKWLESSNPNVPDLSFPQLFDIAVVDTKSAINESEKFFESDYSSAHSFFSDNSFHVPFMRENINLDTGKPVSLNQEIKTLKTPSEVLELGLDNLVERYESALSG